MKGVAGETWEIALEPKTKMIDVEPGSDLAQIPAAALEAPVTPRLSGMRYRLDRERSIGIELGISDIRANYDPECAREGILAAAGA
ncbi:MAG: hypothetical protein M3Q03_21250 [Chloroflexota bacterium]|nr:hypothetical protein [Chloroflexota bacterium]